MKRSQPIVLKDTRGNLYLAFRIPNIKKSRAYTRHLKYVVQWRKRNRKRIKQWSLEYYRKNKQQFKQYYEDNKDRILARTARYRVKNKAIISKKNKIRYRNRKANIT
jgi:hypothetical protein